VRDRTFELEESKQALEGLKKKVENALYTTNGFIRGQSDDRGRLRSEKRNMSVMFTDLVGLQTYSEHAPGVGVTD